MSARDDQVRRLLSLAAQAISGARIEMARSPVTAAERLQDASRTALEAAALLATPEAAPAAEVRIAA